MATLRRILLALEIFVGLAAVGGGALLILRPDGTLLGLDVTLMGGVFASYIIPGVLLFGLGAFQLTAAWLVFKHAKWDVVVSAFAGAALVLWIAAQVVFIGPRSIQQVLFVAIGFLIYTLAMELVHAGDGPHLADDAHAA